MKAETIKIYVRLIDGVEILAPCDAKYIGGEKFEIIRTENLDLDTDATSIWEFFPGDVVKCEPYEGQSKFNTFGINKVARQLISSIFPNRKLHQLIFLIVRSFGKITLDELKGFEPEIKQLCNDKGVCQRNHPVIESWLLKNCELSSTR